MCTEYEGRSYQGSSVLCMRNDPCDDVYVVSSWGDELYVVD